MAKRPPRLQAGTPQRRKWNTTTRRSRKDRGYGWEWEQRRARILRGEPLCRSCRKAGRAVVATDVDHIRPKHLGGTDDDANLQPLCNPCHRAKTAREGRTARP
jgi:5-methylcytosine-specific restriction protein A